MIPKYQNYTKFTSIWDLHAKLGLFGTKFGFWSHLGPGPKFGTSLEGLKMGMQKSHFFPQKHILKISSYCTIRHLLGQ